jgi:D-xylose transport system permease protein
MWLSYLLALIPGPSMMIGRLGCARFAAAGRQTSRPFGCAASFKAVVLTVALEFVVFYLNQDRGIPWMFALFVVLPSSSWTMR